ncbi:MAG: hypothetical protein QOJ15_11782, partial [Bradyrhizobium sp.]|nr:hypothetical protein [Bradyrhizobium sp.]
SNQGMAESKSAALPLGYARMRPRRCRRERGRTKDVLGERGVLGVVAVLGYYGFIAMTMKASAMLPEGVSDPFEGR